MTAYLHVVDDDRLCLQQEAEFGLVYSLERGFKVFLAVSITIGRKDHECSVCSLKSHVEHPFRVNTVFLESLPLQLSADLLIKFVQSGLKCLAVLGRVERR